MLPSAIQWVALCYGHHRKPAHGPDAAGTLRTGHDASAPPAERAVTPHAVTLCRSGADSGPATGHRASHLKPDNRGRFPSQPKRVRFYPFNTCHLLYFDRIVYQKKKGMFKRERTCDLMILNSVTLLGGFSTRSSLARVSFSLCPACQATRRLRGDGSARLRHSPSRRGVTPACPEGPGSTRRSAGHKTTGIRKRAFTAGRRGQPDPTVLGAPGLGREDAPPDGDLATRPRLPPGPGAPDIRPGARHTCTRPQLSLSAP